MKKEVVIYTYKNKEVKLSMDKQSDTIWATQAQIASLFDVERSVVTKHINNILKDKEIDEKSNVQKMHITNSDKPVNLYGLDFILSVGYRTNSSRAIEFRKWASSVLKGYIVDGFSINQKVLHNEKLKKFLNSVEDMKVLLTSQEFSKSDIDSILSLVNTFASTWLALDSYDKDSLSILNTTKKKFKITVKDLESALKTLKEELVKKDEATDLFGKERNKNAIDGILGAVLQSFGGSDVYKSIEEKAANLLYLIVKNHPFIDGNKRSGAFAFVWFLSRAKILDISKLNPNTLTAITLLIAQSPAPEKDKMVALVMNLISKK